MSLSLKTAEVQSAIPSPVTFISDIFGEMQNDYAAGYKGVQSALRKAEATIKEQEEKIRILEALSQTDELTGLSNRRAFKNALNRELSLAKRDASYAGAVIIADLDEFKSVNDRYGHFMGDKLLQLAARIFRECMRSTDIIARIGGDEFAIMCPNISEAKAANRMIKIERMLAKGLVETVSGLCVGISFGAAAYTGMDTVEAVMRSADLRMYRHKTGKKQKATSAC